MNRRLELQQKLEELFESPNVYYQPPENLKMVYPCIRYHRLDMDSIHADNINYRNTTRYQITVIDKKPDNAVIEKIMGLPMSSFDRHFVSDNLNHDVIVLYY